MKLIFAGCGALGSRIALDLAHHDVEFLLIDDDRVEEGNLATGVFSRYHIGAMKAVVLAEMLYMKCSARAIPAVRTVSTRLSAPVGDYLIVDTFDNPAARGFTCGLNTLHAGVSIERTGAVLWDRAFGVPEVTFERGTNVICTRHLGARILRLTAAATANIIGLYLEAGEMRNATVMEFGLVTW